MQKNWFCAYLAFDKHEQIAKNDAFKVWKIKCFAIVQIFTKKKDLKKIIDLESESDILR